MIKGLGKNKLPFLYLDEFCPEIDIDRLHAEVSLGLAKAKWLKRFVSVGVHPEWNDKEIANYIRLENISEYQKELYKQIPEFDTEKKLKYFMCVSQGLHPFWTCFIRQNKPTERTRMANKAVAEDCIWTDEKHHFTTLVEFIEKLPFESIGRIMIFMTEPNNETVPHYDSTLDNTTRPNDDFIWFTTNKDYKKIFVMDGDTKEKFYTDPSKKFIWFNEMDYHGTDPVNRFSFSIRVDGKFTQEVKEILSGDY
tara:strand:- start:169 stop:924 length:756 start_codon:yes stop_codon:yes gene_type:complete